MTNQISAETTFSLEELQDAFAKSYGVPIGQLTVKNLLSEKREAALNNKIATLEKEIFGLKQENSKLISAHINWEDQVDALKMQVADLIAAGPTAEQIAAQAKAVIDANSHKSLDSNEIKALV